MTTKPTLPALKIFTGELTQPTTTDTPLACDLTAITAADRPQHTDATAYLFGPRLQERQELPAGYSFRFKADDYEVVAGFVAQERRCCPFFSFVIELEPNAGPLWLRITGPQGAKEFMQANFNQ